MPLGQERIAVLGEGGRGPGHKKVGARGDSCRKTLYRILPAAFPQNWECSGNQGISILQRRPCTAVGYPPACVTGVSSPRGSEQFWRSMCPDPGPNRVKTVAYFGAARPRRTAGRDSLNRAQSPASASTEELPASLLPGGGGRCEKTKNSSWGRYLLEVVPRGGKLDTGPAIILIRVDHFLGTFAGEPIRGDPGRVKAACCYF